MKCHLGSCKRMAVKIPHAAVLGAVAAAWRRTFFCGALIASVACLTTCGRPAAPSAQTRTYLMGFSATPPRLDIAAVLKTIDTWRSRGDAALLPLTVPWKSILADTAPSVVVRRDQLELVQLYRSYHFPIVVEIDATDGLAREREAPELVALGRSIREPAVQQKYREYVAAVDSILHPEYMALVMETNLSRALLPRDVYDSLRTMVNAAAAELAAGGSEAILFVSVQVETAWGRLPNTGSFVGIDDDLRDFPFMRALGLSSYPFLGGFTEPEQVPIDYYRRLLSSGSLPMLVVEGGWSSGSVPGVVSSPERQARWIKRHAEIADEARLAALFQITFTDLDLTSFPAPPGSILPLFAQLGLVDETFHPKPALATWDGVFARRRVAK